MSIATLDALPNDTLPTDTPGSSTGSDGGGLTAETFGVSQGAQQQAADTIAVNDQAAADAKAQQDAANAGSTVTQTVSPTDIPVVSGSGIGAKIVAAAEHYLGTPYDWGGTSANGVDCSGLVQLAYKAVGINLPRVSFEQANSGTRVAIKSLRPGDLVAWDNSSRNAGADHIAVYLGNGKIIEAPREGQVVHITNLYDLGEAWGVRMGWK